MKFILQKLILIILICTRLNGICQNKSELEFKYHIIKYEKIDFLHMDTVYPFTVFIEPDGYFYFHEGFDISSNNIGNLVWHSNNIPKTVFIDTLIKKSDNIIKLFSFFPLLIKNDSSIINHYTSAFQPGIYYELENSYILKNLKEPKIYDINNLKSIRVILPSESFRELLPSGAYKGKKKYEAIRVSFGEKNRMIYSKGEFDSESNFYLITKDSIIISDKETAYLDKILQEFNFNREYYFTEVGADIHPKYLLEYKTPNAYYVLARQLFSRDKKDKELNKLVDVLLTIRNKNWTKK